MGGASQRRSLSAVHGAWCKTLIFNKRSHLVSLDLGELCVSQSHTTQPKGGGSSEPLRISLCTPQKTAVKVQWIRLKRPQ